MNMLIILIFIVEQSWLWCGKNIWQQIHHDFPGLAANKTETCRDILRDGNSWHWSRMGTRGEETRKAHGSKK